MRISDRILPTEPQDGKSDERVPHLDTMPVIPPGITSTQSNKVTLNTRSTLNPLQYIQVNNKYRGWRRFREV